MRERPIIFSTEMVKAILAGRKTQTRRVIKPQPPYDEEEVIKCQYGSQGDLLWVRETWGYEFGTPEYLYKASHEHMKRVGGLSDHKWRPSIHMPKDAARIWLEVTQVRAERLWNISEQDALEEGIYRHIPVPGDGDTVYRNYDENVKYGVAFRSPIASFATLWESINGPGSWQQNPFVWVVNFKVLSTNGKPKGGQND